MVIKIIFPSHNRIREKLKYKNYFGWISEKDDEYQFSASRNYSLGNQNKFNFKEWQNENHMSLENLEQDSQSVKQNKTF